MLVTLNDVLYDAQKNHYGVGLFNTTDTDMLEAVISAAEELRSPVIIGTAEGLLPYGELSLIGPSIIHKAKEASVPVVVHFDHGVSFERCLEALKIGFSSIMFDGSADDIETNLKNTAEMARIAHAFGATIEGEIGHVGQADTADTQNHQDGRAGGMTHTTHGADENVQNTVDEQRHSNPQQMYHTCFNKSRVAGVEAQTELAEEPYQEADGCGADNGQNHGLIEDGFDTFQIICADVLAGEGDTSLGEGAHTDVNEVFHVGSGAVACNDSGRTEGVDTGLNNYVADGVNNTLQTSRYTNFDDIPRHWQIDAQFLEVQMVWAFFLFFCRFRRIMIKKRPFGRRL